MGANKNRLNPDILKKMEERLRTRHGELTEGMRTHEYQVRHTAPSSSREGGSIKEEIEMMGREEDLEKKEIHLVEEALERIHGEDFGICLDCGKPIPIERLEVLSHAKYCVPCEEKIEKGDAPRSSR